jgi:2-keto-4-pentenoate hydratase/2-oxohepta-3-ene-1,7-dioic acid hydratase in catechol pathway
MRIARAQVDGRDLFGEVEGDWFHPLAGDAFAGSARAGDPVPLTGVTLQSPAAPRTLLVTMGGYRAADGTPPPAGAVPWLVPKLPGVISGDNGEVVVPAFVTTVWIEVELAIVIGRRVRNATENEARAAIFGFTCFNDVSAPQFLFADVATLAPAAEFDIWRAKSIETFASMGPWVCTDMTEEQVRQGLGLKARVNGVIRAQGNTRDHKFSASTWVMFASRHTTLYPGDVISLGTPQPCEAAPGDAVELEIEGIGTLRNRLVGESAGDLPAAVTQPG